MPTFPHSAAVFFTCSACLYIQLLCILCIVCGGGLFLVRSTPKEAGSGSSGCLFPLTRLLSTITNMLLEIKECTTVKENSMQSERLATCPECSLGRSTACYIQLIRDLQLVTFSFKDLSDKELTSCIYITLNSFSHRTQFSW